MPRPPLPVSLVQFYARYCAQKETAVALFCGGRSGSHSRLEKAFSSPLLRGAVRVSHLEVRTKLGDLATPLKKDLPQALLIWLLPPELPPRTLFTYIYRFLVDIPDVRVVFPLWTLSSDLSDSHLWSIAAIRSELALKQGEQIDVSSSVQLLQGQQNGPPFLRSPLDFIVITRTLSAVVVPPDPMEIDAPTPITGSDSPAIPHSSPQLTHLVSPAPPGSPPLLNLTGFVAVPPPVMASASSPSSSVSTQSSSLHCLLFPRVHKLQPPEKKRKANEVTATAAKKVG